MKTQSRAIRSDNTETSCFTCQQRERTEWCILTDEELALLDRGRIMRDYLPGDVIFNEGDPCRGVHCVESGLVGVRKTNAEGDSVLLYLVQPGETLGYRALLATEDYRASAEALERSRVCTIDAATVRALLNHNPALGLRYLQRMSRNIGAAEERILHNATLSVRARFAHLLTVLADRYAEDKSRGAVEFRLPLSRHDLASMIGTTPESMSRTIAKLEKDGIAHFSGRRVTIPEIDVLVREFEPDQYV